MKLAGEAEQKMKTEGEAPARPLRVPKEDPKMKLQPLTQFEVNQPLMSWTRDRYGSVPSCMGANVDLRASRRQPLFMNALELDPHLAHAANVGAGVDHAPLKGMFLPNKLEAMLTGFDNGKERAAVMT